ncbi:hypothetical protein FVEN_g836 [Fusarium venenatum]|uniref:Uncharacterized protein n=1 Tax=Fusarium venenatum TaxID=56646 RepID=A0A2L2TKK2_9HYPO|nr:uncharacterized protein FVRRES_10755 [Fusarium venenatum]KAG8361678.1 hypothetical protein FVEN_g836 [Fusarium venenatum]KAH6967335.1 hypothetical protein EDB82DRAFT_542319 [Fusarium venenatum]CEI70678.1 unnamed protein product [Fusarium venenatum]
MTNSPKTSFMRAVQWEGELRHMSVNIIPRPKLVDPEDAVVRITTSAICGSDLHIYHGLFGTDEKFGVGHEGVGIVEEVGPAVDFLKPGDRVLITGFSEDGNLLPKTALVPNDLDIVGVGFGSSFNSEGGLQAEYVRIPWADSSLAKIPHGLDDKEWLPLTDIFPTGWTALTRSGFQPGDTVAVFGAGGVGLMCAYSAIIRGASLVYVIDHVPARLALAASIGAQPINFTRGGKASEQILALRPAGVNRAIDCVGQFCLNENLKPQPDFILREAVKIATNGGGLGIAGLYQAGGPEGYKSEINFAIPELWIKSLQVGSGLVDIKGNIRGLVDLVRNGRARPGFVFSNEYSLEEAPLAYRRFEQHQETKVMLKGVRKQEDDELFEIQVDTNGVTDANGA